MKKNTLLILFFNSILGFFSFSQDILITEEVKEIRKPLKGSWNGIMVFEDRTPRGGVGSEPSYNVDYQLLNTKTDAIKEVKSRPENDIAIKSNHIYSFVNGKYIYELFLFSGKARYESYGFIKRNIETGNQEGEILLLEKKGFIKRVSFDNNGIHILINDSNEYFSKEYFLFRLNFDLSIEWSKKIDILSNSEVSISTISIDEDFNFLISILISEKVKMSLFRLDANAKSGLAFIIIDSDGNIKNAAPELPGNLFALSSKFKYYPEKQELVGLFVIAEVINERTSAHKGIGYQYVRWDEDGAILASKQHWFTPKELESDELTNFIEITKFKIGKMSIDNKFPEIDFNKPLKFIFTDQQEVIVASSDFDCGITEILNSKFLFCVANSGDLKWLKFIPLGPHPIYKKSCYYYENDKLHFLINDFSRNFESNQYKFITFKEPITPESSQFYDKIIDCKDGEILSFEPIVENPMPNCAPNLISFENNIDQIILRYSNTLKNLERYIVLNY